VLRRSRSADHRTCSVRHIHELISFQLLSISKNNLLSKFNLKTSVYFGMFRFPLISLTAPHRIRGGVARRWRGGDGGGDCVRGGGEFADKRIIF